MLNWEDIEDFLNNPTQIKEKQYLECKKAKNSLPKDFWKSFSAFSNTEGGFILLGISEENKHFIITGVEEPSKMVDEIYSQARGQQKISYHYLDNESIRIFEEKKVIAVYVKKAENNRLPVFLNGDCANSYVRRNTGDHKLNINELQTFLSGYKNINEDYFTFRD